MKNKCLRNDGLLYEEHTLKWDKTHWYCWWCGKIFKEVT